MTEVRQPSCAIDGQVALDCHARRSLRDEHDRLATVRFGIGAGLGHDGEDLAALAGNAEDPPLAFGGHVLVSVADDLGRMLGSSVEEQRTGRTFRSTLGEVGET
jgi:hypothetical protein